MFATMWRFYILSLFCLVGWSNSQSCPAQYKRFTPRHTFCIRRNPRCDIKRSGVSQKEIEDFENIREKGGVPWEMNTGQLVVWDEQLAAVAQKWAENCDFNHDCGECRTVENFAVGQNLVIQGSTCQGHGCKEDKLTQPNWQKAIKRLYEEVLGYQKDWLWSFEEHDGPQTGHFTQVIWSRSWRIVCGYTSFKECHIVLPFLFYFCFKFVSLFVIWSRSWRIVIWSRSWRIGCGYTSFKEGGKYKRFYVCNYGPGGNVAEQPVYKNGQPCSACPINSCCGSSCGGGLSYPGLCKILDPNTAPKYRKPSNLFFCGASSNDEDCQASVTGANKWKKVKSVGGNYDSIVLKGGESSTVTFNKAIIPTKNSFCLLIKFQKGPVDASRGDQSSFTANFKMDYSFASPMQIRSRTLSFTDIKIHLRWGVKTKIAFTFSVPRGAGRHVLDIREISAYDGPCDSLSI
ncbi:CRISP/Allergen/PR-1 like protein [Argiope bruennichi]|uniref:CRISP/Allergen/PR-1 like protein n=1 Tax=Argiope bruennichi TaxID=94029 RepID=A0A8T0E5X9_ARGBR|nr:CRISP/Allergen/PR-1 like protein [Argiope bruennichi]